MRTLDDAVNALMTQYGAHFEKLQLLRALLALAYSQGVVDGGKNVHEVTMRTFQEVMGPLEPSNDRPS